MARKMVELLGSYQEYPVNSVGKQARKIIPDSGASKKLAGFFI
jgi:hypothetical protein